MFLSYLYKTHLLRSVKSSAIKKRRELCIGIYKTCFFFFCHFSVLCRSFWLRFSTLLYNLTFEMIRPRWISTKNDSNSELRRALLSYHSVWFSSHPNGDGKIPFSVQDAGLDLVVKQARWDSKILQAYQVKQIFSATVVWKIKDYSY